MRYASRDADPDAPLGALDGSAVIATTAAPAPRGRVGRALRPAMQLAAWMAAYAGLAVVGRLTVLPGGSLGLVWPAVGLGLVWLLSVRGVRSTVTVLALMGLVLALVLGLTGAGPAVTAVATLANLVETVLAVTLLRRWVPGLLGTGGVRSVHSPGTLVRGVAAVLVGVTTGALVFATGTVLLLGFTGPAEVARSLADFGSRHLAGTVMVAAVVHLGWEWWRERAGTGRAPWSRARRLEAVLLVLGSAGAYVAVFAQNGLPVGFTLMIPAVWCASRFSTFAAVVHTAVFGAVAVALTLGGQGPFSSLDDPGHEVLITQVFLLTVLLTVLAIATGRDEQRRLAAELDVAHRETAARAELLDTITESLDEGLVVVGADGRLLRTNAAARSLLSMTETGLRPNTTEYQVRRVEGSVLPPEELPSRRALREGEVAAHDLLVWSGGEDKVLSVSATALTGDGPAGSFSSALVVYRDVTADRQQRTRLAEFAGVVAHDLRNPLTALSGWVDLAHARLRTTPDEPEKVALALERAQRSVRSMTEMVADLLAQATAEGGPIHPEELRLEGPDGLLAEVADELGLRLELAEGSWPPLLADPDLVRQLLANLLGNAQKYVAAGVEPCVAARAHRSGERVVLSLRDNGIGVPAEQREQVFDRFHRAHASDRSYSGTGLGLAICRTVVERHGGRISCRPVPDGDGSEFVMDLPAAPRAA